MAYAINKKIISYKVISNEDKINAEQAKTEAEIQELTNRFIALVEKHLESKEKEIMAI